MYACSRAGLLTIPLLPTQLLSPSFPPPFPKPAFACAHARSERTHKLSTTRPNFAIVGIVRIFVSHGLEKSVQRPTQVELHVVEKCRSVKSDAVWVQRVARLSEEPQLLALAERPFFAAQGRRRVARAGRTTSRSDDDHGDGRGGARARARGQWFGADPRSPADQCERDTRVKPVAAQSIPNGPRSRSGSSLRPRCTRHRRGRNPKNSRLAPEWQL